VYGSRCKGVARLLILAAPTQRNETRRVRARIEEAEEAAAQASQRAAELEQRLVEDAEAHAAAVADLTLIAEEERARHESELATQQALCSEAIAALDAERAQRAEEKLVRFPDRGFCTQTDLSRICRHAHTAVCLIQRGNVRVARAC
jgi:hypothetical protein